MRSYFSTPPIPLLLALMASGLSCGSPMDEGPRRVVGTIDNGASFDPLSLPDTVAVGVPFTATVSTLRGACTRPDGADVHVAGLLADITLFDLLPPAETVCIAVLVGAPRSLVLTFATPGPALVRLHGRGPNGDLTVEHSITVRP